METYDLWEEISKRYIYCIFRHEASKIVKFVGVIEATSVGSAIIKICRKQSIPHKYVEHDYSEVGIKYVRKME